MNAIPDETGKRLLQHLSRGGWMNYWNKNAIPVWWPAGQPAPVPGWKDVYFSVHPRLTRLQGKQRGGNQEVAAVNCLYAEVDQKDGWTAEKVQALDPAPSVVVASGGGWHLYWLLPDPVLVTDENYTSLIDLQYDWVEYIGGDPGAQDLARVLRVPGSLNSKYNPPRPVKVIRADFACLYNLDQLRTFIPPPADADKGIDQERQSAGWQDGAAGHQNDGDFWLQRALDQAKSTGRNKTGFWLAVQLRDAGLSRSEAEGIMIRYQGLVDGWKDHHYTTKEVQDSLGSAYKTGPREPARKPGKVEARKEGNVTTRQNTPPAPPEEQQAQRAPAGIKFSTFADLEKMLGPITWSWPGWLPNGFLTILAAEPGIGKSSLMMHACGPFLLGKDWPDGTPYTGEPGAIVWAEAEAAQALNWERAKRWGFPLNRMYFPTEDPLGDFVFDNPKHRDNLREMAMLPDVRFVVYDSLSGSTRRNEKDSEIKGISQFLAMVARDSGKPVMLAHHLRKKTVFDPNSVTVDRLRGFSGIAQYARMIWALDIPNQNQPENIRLAMIKSNLSRRADPLGMQITEEGITFGDPPEEPKVQTLVDQGIDLLLALLARGPELQAKIEQDFKGKGISAMTMRRAKKDLRVVSFRQGDRWYWSLPAGKDEPN